MNLNELTNYELEWNLQRLHAYLNRKYFNSELKSITIKFDTLSISADAIFVCGEINNQIVINIQKLTVYKCMTRSIPDRAEKLQLQWLVTIMLHGMVDQYLSECCDADPDEVAENVGLMQYGNKTEWINPLRFAFIQNDFSLCHTDEKQIAPIAVKG